MDTCDTCGYPATVKAIKNTMTLTFCGHHGRGNILRLRNEGWAVTDGRDELLSPVYAAPMNAT